MEKMKSTLHNLKSWHKMVIGAVLLAVITSISLYMTIPGNYTVLYQGLTENDKQDILTELSKLGVEYKLKEDGSISVPEQDVAWVRNTMTEMGLPYNGTSGDEILLEGSLGASEQDKRMRQIVGIRKQLEQDIVRNFAIIETANVQLTLPEEESIFSDTTSKGTAAVTIGVNRGQQLTPQQILGIQYMVSSAVTGVASEDVSVIDSRTGVVSTGGEVSSDVLNSSSYEKELALQQQIEDRLKKDIEQTLINIFAIDNFKVNTRVKVNYDEVMKQTETYGDEGVLRSRQEQLEQSAAIDGTGMNLEAGIETNGDVPVYKNADGTINGNVIYDQDNESRTENFEIDKTVETIKKHPELTNTNIVVWVDEETLMERNIDINAFRQAVATAAGIQATPEGTFANGQVNIMQVPFEPAPAAEDNAAEETGTNMNWLIIGGIAGVTLLTGAGIMFMMIKRKKKKKQKEEAAKEEAEAAEFEAAAAANLNQVLISSGPAAIDIVKQEDTNTLDAQAKKIASENVEATAKIIKKWLSGS